MTRTPVRWIVVGSVALLAGCGAGPGGSASFTASAVVRASVDRTEAAGTAHLQVTSVSHLVAPSGSTAVPTVDHIDSVGDVRFAGPDLRLATTSSSTGAGTQTVTAVYLGRTVYLEIGPDPTRWVRSTAAQAYPFLGVVQARALRTMTGPVVVVGRDQVGGRPVTEYRVTIPGTTRTLPFPDSRNHAVTHGIDIASHPLWVWIDRSGRIVRTRATVVVTTPSDGRRVTETTTATLSDFGVPVQIVRPAASTGG